MSPYIRALCDAMSLCSGHRETVFIGQSCLYPGTAMYTTLSHLPEEKRVEFPVAENMQLGLCIGASLTGWLPISIFPRINFLLEAISQLVQHLDKIPLYSDYDPKAIIRTAVAHNEPLDPGPQHLGNYVAPLRMMLKTVLIEELTGAEQVVPAYQRALMRDGSTILVEHMRLY